MTALIIRNARTAAGGQPERTDVAVDEGRITDIGPSLPGTAQTEIDADGRLLLPGFIDAHVHFNEPGREDWEGLASGSAALAAGGGTCYFDMPLNSDPPVLSARELIRKRALAESKSLLDFALWGGLCPDHVEALDEMADAGAVGFKAFLCPSGIPEFPAADPKTLRNGLQRAARRRLPVAVHAESPDVLARAARGVRGTSMASYLASRPKEAEIAAIRMACETAGETGGALHVVHVSCAEGLQVIEEARAAGADVTAETCPHYLLFNAADAVQIGARAKCSPPLRPAGDVAALWRSLLAGQIDTIGTDHSPAPPERKSGGDFFAIWGGIAGCQHAFPCLLGELHRRAPESVLHAARWFATNAAERFGLADRKGRIAVGCDADLVLAEFADIPPIDPSALLTRHAFSLYEGREPGCRIVHVLRRGELIVSDGVLVRTAGRGTFQRPNHG